MTTRRITRRFRNDPDMGIQMLIDGGWCEMPMRGPKPHDPDGELAFAAISGEPTGEFIVSITVSTHPLRTDMPWSDVKTVYPPRGVEIITELDDGQLVDGWVSGGDKSTLKLRSDDGLYWRHMWAPYPVRWRLKAPSEPELRLRRESL